jgi:hypothetical protein
VSIDADGWCEVMDMGKAGCAHCRADRARLDALERELSGESALGPVFSAGYASKCHVCDGLIYVGDEARRAPEGFIHAACGRKRARRG